MLKNLLRPKSNASSPPRHNLRSIFLLHMPRHEETTRHHWSSPHRHRTREISALPPTSSRVAHALVALTLSLPFISAATLCLSLLKLCFWVCFCLLIIFVFGFSVQNTKNKLKLQSTVADVAV
ncbi:hypothetical protein Pint_27086 [Pistacia integerrima]|uniref:Uncharacterized protein n=1 Tax=Pistacia integerrima TaxID=434235 RepID=A0ACC0YQ92_9ROSI|nr:hypothetical protein Pint_27086 [Pistacia integerrima]